MSQLAREARALIEREFSLVFVQGELSNLRRPGSGHWYFTLKDQSAQLRCAMFAGRNRGVRVQVRDGMEVLLRGRISLYEPRGDFQLIVDQLAPAGEGALRARYEALKAELEAQGLFDPATKRPLPAFPRRIALVTSVSGAVIRDVLTILARRYPATEVVVLPCSVQGDRATADIVAALGRLGTSGADLAILARGGGSLEDLWAFNTEPVARAIAGSKIPVISAIGHQTDFTIADFAADVRAPTPSAAAELCTPDAGELLTQVHRQQQRLRRALDAQLRENARHLYGLARRLRDPRAALQQQMQRTDELLGRLVNATQRNLAGRHQRLAHLATRQRAVSPVRTVETLHQRTATARRRLTAATRSLLARAEGALQQRARTLNAVSPLGVLARGYAVVLNEAGIPVASIADVTPGDALTAQLQDGRVRSTVADVSPVTLLQAIEDPTNHDA